MSEKQVRRVTVELRFVALLTPGDAGDSEADAITDGIVKALEAHTPVGVFDQSFSIGEWDDQPETEDE